MPGLGRILDKSTRVQVQVFKKQQMLEVLLDFFKYLQKYFKK